MADEKPRRSPTLDLPIFEIGFTQFPTILVDELMPFAAGIPASFWKYLLVLWRDLFGMGCVERGYRAAKTMTQFNMDKDTANQWTAALSVSGLFKVTNGRRYDYNTPGIPTIIQYRANATVAEWQCFIIALRDEILRSKASRFKTMRDGVWGFRISLSFVVDSERQRRGLPRLFDKWHNELEKSGDIGRGDGGNFTWVRPRTDRGRVKTA